MNISTIEILKYALIATSATIIGCLIALYIKPSDKLRGFLLHFAAGIIFSVVAVEILPDIVHRNMPLDIVIGFSMGVITMFLVKMFSEKMEDDHESNEAKIPWGLIVAGCVDEFIDGLLIGIGFIAGQKEGILLTVALAVEVFVFSLAVTSTLRNKNISKGKTVLIMASMAMLFLIGTMLGATLLSNLTANWLEIILSFGLAALLYLVTEELLTEAYEMKESPWLTSAFFVGFLLFLIIGIIV
jgi:ZIP family zinc transporter